MCRAAHLVELAQQVRGGTIELLEACPEEWLLWSPPGTSNHILWHAGHVVWLQEVLCLRPLTGRSALDTDWVATFGMNCRPPAETRDWPTRPELVFRLRLQLEEMLMALLKHADRLDEIASPPAHGWGLLPGILHGLHDEARHQGEMYLLWKLCRAGHRG